MRRYLVVIKLVVSGLLLWLVLRSIPIDSIAARLELIQPLYVLLGIALLAAQIVVATRRWQLIVTHLSGAIQGLILLRFFLVGHFFNQLLPSTIGGDGMRAWLLVKVGAGIELAIHGVLIDRMIGLLALLLLMVCGLPFQELAISEPVALYTLIFLSAAGLGGFAVLFLLASPLGRPLKRLWLLRHLRELTISLYRTAAHPSRAWRFAVLAPLVHFLSIAGLWAFARALELDIGLLELAILVPPMLLISMIPISIAGWGLREGVMVTGLGFLGIPAEGALILSVMYGLGLLAVSLPGGLIWLLQGRSSGALPDRVGGLSVPR